MATLLGATHVFRGAPGDASRCSPEYYKPDQNYTELHQKKLCAPASMGLVMQKEKLNTGNFSTPGEQMNEWAAILHPGKLAWALILKRAAEYN